ncbi:OTU domain-containing protein 6B [Mactra antiquata]
MATAKFIQRSIREKRSQEMVLWYHTKRLEKLLASNMLKRKEIPGDGNCLPSPVLHHVGWPMSTPELRLKIAQYITDNITDYISFVTFEDKFTEEEELKTFIDRGNKTGW